VPIPALLRALPLLLVTACARDYLPTRAPIDEGSAVRVAEILEGASDLAQIVDGRVLVLPEAYHYETRKERRVLQDGDGFGVFLLDEERPVRVLRGPRRVQVPLSLVRSVSARTGPLVANVEIELKVPVPGVPGPPSHTLLILAAEPEMARSLVDGLDLILRASRSPAAP
jgi:hypothetical protein